MERPMSVCTNTTKSRASDLKLIAGLGMERSWKIKIKIRKKTGGKYVKKQNQVLL